MNRIAILDVFWEYENVTYYTVCLVDGDNKHELSETDKFYERFDREDDEYFSEFDAIVRSLDGIGHYKRGAESHFFRFEEEAGALPPKPKDAKRDLGVEVIKDSKLRLYCIRLTSEVVVLLNGGIKTKDQALDCPNVKGHFKLAKAIAKGIDEAIREKNIKIVGHNIINLEGEEEVVIYYK